jgi:hypothetical protein
VPLQHCCRLTCSGQALGGANTGQVKNLGWAILQLQYRSVTLTSLHPFCCDVPCLVLRMVFGLPARQQQPWWGSLCAAAAVAGHRYSSMEPVSDCNANVDGCAKYTCWCRYLLCSAGLWVSAVSHRLVKASVAKAFAGGKRISTHL